MSYLRFFAMIAVSTVVMFVLMYLNTYALEHVRFSETRVYMALLMGAVFDKAVRKYTSAFEARAHALYGQAGAAAPTRAKS